MSESPKPSNPADLGREILEFLKLRQGQVKVSLLRCGAVLVEKEERS
jgi:hypothetical protein